MISNLFTNLNMMTTLTVLEVLYIFLIAFVAVIWTLLSIVLYKVIKILGPITEMVETYDKVKNIIDLYASIPNIIVDWIKDTASQIWKR